MNLPGGEVFTAPAPDSVEGGVLFDKPLLAQGREVTDVRLEFEAGEVVDYSAAKNEDVLTAMLNTDDGARRLGELGIGMNRDIDRFTYNVLFDEKMGDTVHMAIGRAIEGSRGTALQRQRGAHGHDRRHERGFVHRSRRRGRPARRDVPIRRRLRRVNAR